MKVHTRPGSRDYLHVDAEMLQRARLLPRLMGMGVRLASVFSTTFIGPLPASAAETLVFTTGPIGLVEDFAQVILLWCCSITTGTSTTSLKYALRRGPLVTSPLVNVSTFAQTSAAGNLTTVTGVYVDNAAGISAPQYSLTVVQTACTVAGTFVDGALLAVVL